MGLVSLKSNLAINGTPERYDTQGKLETLPPGASQLDFGGALPPPVDNFININANGFTLRNPVGVTQFTGLNGNTYVNPSGLNALRTVDYFQDPFSGAKGFKDRLAPYESGYIGISADSTKYQYPSTVNGGRLLNVRLGQGAGTAKLENQLGNGSKMGNNGFYAENRYDEAVRNADNGSLLASWALRRRSPSPLEQQYSKFKLRDEAFNPTFIAHPLILRGLQNTDVLNPQRWGLDALGQQEGRTAGNNVVAAIDGGFIRGGASTALERSAIDTARIAKFMSSPKGLIWSITQIGLGKSNIRPHGAMPYAEIALATQNPLPLLNNTQTHLGLTSLLSVPGSAFGLHFTRHGVPFLNEVASYEYVLKSFTRAEIDSPGTMFHKHLRLKDELLDLNNPNVVGIGSPISNLSYVGGPQSVYGLGNTTVKRATDTLEGWKRYKPKSVPPPAEIKEVPTDDLPIEEIGSVSAQFSARQAQAVIDANTAAAKINAENARLAEQYKKLDTEFSPKYSISKQYAPELNNNETLQGNIQESKTEGKRLGTSNADWEDANAALGIGKKLKDLENTYRVWSPGNGTNPNLPSKNLNEVYPSQESPLSGNKYRSLPYSEIRTIARNRSNRTSNINDFRIKANESANIDTKTFSTNPDLMNYAKNNLTDRYGFGKHGSTDPSIDRSDPYRSKNNTGTPIDNIDGTLKNLKELGKNALASNANFRGDKITAIDYVPESKKVDKTEIYPEGVRDFIKFYFSGIGLYNLEKDDAIVFRSTIKGLSDTFSPSWNPVSIMGRPDGPAIYSSFDRNISFNFTVAATSREELVPMWRKLNYLASYTMPIYGDKGRPGGALCRMTLGDMFNNTPGYFTGLSVTINDEASWDLADDLINDPTTGISSRKNKYAKQLPNIVDVDVQFKIIHDWRPQKGGRVYSLYDGNFSPVSAEGNWLWDSNI